ncbi:UDP-glucose 4-epimerase GalE [Floricoccus penangensis]|uniref:UDP-glucose 4-epimerase n=1 Tax=Floricoccus penangensis TaxID=1859475 RepID=A0A9Q5JHG9_9LACT|nr:UDP-glucose 4-epimerase GalE [Floricoccus penangensis]OFI47400.1 UDP-glucose 4-epimerase GalE [Floricoccus penangensis]
MTVLVLGGAGYIGSHAVDQLLSKGYDVAVVDNLSTGHREAIPASVPFYEGDIRDRTFLSKVFSEVKDIEGVMHFCAFSLVGESMEKPLKYFDNNTYGAVALLEVMQEFDVQHVVFSSTAATFGKVDVMPITEETPTNPINPYGQSKLMMEQIMKWQSQATDMTYVALRYFNVAGAKTDGSIGEAHTCETHLIPILMQVALGQRESIQIYGDDYNTPDGTNVRDYVQVEDLIDAHVRALEYLKAGGQSDFFNLGSQEGFSNLQILEAARRVTEHEIPAVLSDRRPGDPDSLYTSSEKAKSILGWEPTYKNIDDIIATAWAWHSKHPQGYKY